MSTVLLVLEVPSKAAFQDPAGLRPEWSTTIQDAVRKVRQDDSSNPETPSRIAIFFVLLPSQISSSGAPAFSFEQLEKFLQWVYAQAWSVAVERDQLLLDVDVLLVHQRHLLTTIQGQLQRSKGHDVQTLCDAKLVQTLPSEFSSLLENATPISFQHDSERSSASETTSSAALPQHPVVALGGTFDHLHPGHKILLSCAAALATRKLIIGITTDEMLAKKAEAHLLEDLETRKERVRDFVDRFWNGLHPDPHQSDASEGEGQRLEIDAVTLKDVAGPAGTEEDLQALVLTDETISGGEFIDKVRAEKGLGALEHFVIGVLGAKGETDLGGKGTDAKTLAAAKVGSTAIRKWLAAKQGSS
ncbi:Elongator subunit elp2 [Tilletia horrida]|uniref:Elongator subunit elp2 n=1 Tax=Tilletia horrida TaxID=155126 RepID=A0AAN6GTN2_9BASI|nr:Elongator subunit elp2 [Tilletia horrida]